MAHNYSSAVRIQYSQQETLTTKSGKTAVRGMHELYFNYDYTAVTEK